MALRATEFSFATAGRIRFGLGVSKELPGVVADLTSIAAGQQRHQRHRVLLITGSNPVRHAKLLDQLPPGARFQVANEPTMDDARQAVVAAQACGADVIVGLGGGSVIDLAKATGILLASGRDPMEHAEVIGQGVPLPQVGVPVVAVPTTAGTGSEVTRNSVLTSPEHQVKVSLRSEAMLPRVALVDPGLTVDCPPAVTASSGMDALTQCLEPLTSNAANPMTDGFALAGLRAAPAIRQAYLDGSDLEARTQMSLCSLFGGLSLANAKLGAVHGLAGVIGGMTGARHGDICAALLAPVTAANVSAMSDRDPDNPALERYSLAAEALCGVPQVEAALEWIWETVRILDIGGLEDLGLAPERFADVIAAGRRASSMKGNPIELSDDELMYVLESSR